MRLRSTGAKVSVSNCRSSARRPLKRHRCGQQPNFNTNAKGVGLIVSGSLETIIWLERYAAGAFRNSMRSFVHSEITADAMTCSVVKIETGLPE